MSKVSELKDTVELHKDCLLQSLGRDYSLGIGRKVYFCTVHKVTFAKIIPLQQGLR